MVGSAEIAAGGEIRPLPGIGATIALEPAPLVVDDLPVPVARV